MTEEPDQPLLAQDSRISRMNKYNSLPNQRNVLLPPHLKWNTLKELFDDPEGLELFNRYIQTKEALWNIIKTSYLHFLQSDTCIQHISERAVEAMMKTDENVFGGQLPPIIDLDSRTLNESENYSNNNESNTSTLWLSHLKWNTLKGLLDHPVGSKLFNRYVQTEEALWIITKTSYHNFFQSDIYNQHVEKGIVEVASVPRKCPDDGEYSVHPAEGDPIQTINDFTVDDLRSENKKFDADQVSITTSLDNKPDNSKKCLEETKNEVRKELSMNVVPRLRKVRLPHLDSQSRQPACKAVHSSEKFISELIPKLEDLCRQQHMDSTFYSLVVTDINQRNDKVIVPYSQCPTYNQSTFDQHVSQMRDAPTPVANRECIKDSFLDEGLGGEGLGEEGLGEEGLGEEGLGEEGLVEEGLGEEGLGQEGLGGKGLGGEGLGGEDLGGQGLDAFPTLKRMIRRQATYFKRPSSKWPSTDSGTSSMYSTLRSTGSRSMANGTIFKLNKLHKPSSTSTESTVVVYKYANEDIPFRLKIPGLVLTLRQFKKHLPKGGNFRFFFKTTSEDADNPVIKQEIVRDDEVLPLFNGIVTAFIRKCE